ncbi:MAG: phage portal protein [Culicoidibacterales bacterium]
MFKFKKFTALQKVYFADADEEIRFDDVMQIIKNRRSDLKAYYEMNEEMYSGTIVTNEKYFSSNENNLNQQACLYANFAKYIVDTLTGYFMGKGVQVSSDDKAIKEILKQLEDDNDTNNEIAKMTALYGHAFDYTFVDENNELQTTFIHPSEVVMIYSNDVQQRPLAACHFQKMYKMLEGVNSSYLKGVLYTNNQVVHFTERSGNLEISEPELNPFGRIPIVEYIENEERLGAFDAVTELLAGYSNTLTQKSNDVAYFADALLLLLGVTIDDKAEKGMRENRVLNVERYDKEMMPDVKFLERPSNDATQENLLKHLAEDIHIISNVPKMTDENFGTASGIAMKYKLWGLETIRSTKERKFRYALKQRFLVYAAYLELNKSLVLDVSQLKFTFFANQPNDSKEEIEIVRNLTGIISHQTQLDQIDFIDNVDAELQRIEEEKNGQMGDQYGKI